MDDGLNWVAFTLSQYYDSADKGIITAAWFFGKERYHLYGRKGTTFEEAQRRMY